VDKTCCLAAESASFREFVDRVFEVILTKAGKTRWAEKTPSNCYCIPEFLSLYPFGKYVHVVRDGRDVVESLTKRNASPEASVRRWLYDTVTGLPHRENDRYHEVKYEELVTHPEHTLARLLAFLEVDGNPGALIEQARTQPLVRETHHPWNVQPNEPLSNISVGKWKQHGYGDKRYVEQLFRYTVLSEQIAQIMMLERTYNANDVLLEFGYDPFDHWDPQPSYGARILSHFLTESSSQLLHRKKLYFRVSWK
jgi:hypothetical protein